MMKLMRLIVVVGLAMLACQGCASRAIKEAIEFGGKGSFAMVAPGPGERSVSLAGYTRFELEDLKDDSGGHAPAEFFYELPAAFTQALVDARIPDRSGRTLVVKGRVLYYESANLMGQVFGPHEEVVARVFLVDKESGRTICEANCVGRTKTTRNQGPRQKAVGLARGIAKLISENFPESEKLPED